MDLKRSDFLPAYDEEGVRIVLSEMTDLHSKLVDLYERHPGMANLETLDENVKVTLIYYTGCMNRNSRYLSRYCDMLN